MIEKLTAVPGADAREDPDEDPALLRRVLGLRLRRLREAAGISGDAAGRVIRASHSKISRLEAGRVSFRAMDIDDLLTAYGVHDAGARAEYLRLAHRANAVGRWQAGADLTTARPDTYLALEDSAALIRCYAPSLMPELVRTPSYAHTIFAIAHRESAGEIGQRVELLVRRQQLLIRAGSPKLWFVIEEAALRRQIGGSAMWHSQLDHLAELAARPDITVQVLPDHVGGPAISDTAFTLLRFAATELSDIAYLQHLAGAQFLDKTGDLDRFNAIWDRLSVCAAPPEYTADLLDTLRTSVSTARTIR
ncbi:helix-turn-helix domain-containing protein [Nocardia sp. NBC_01503]|uniref:helix-turn-helix domain-containing protein n=1 Tax=Nocardia sp. NBC_01503 TaxID=2975997 RepID=UPI002E7B5997|nr:helix-turn-helix transcriptional regulator [Nocardia sp. NBC_01503]WTL30675.1 helix-turn-helix domain-containing protein [Nocardia sp. NBC_01503]